MIRLESFQDGVETAVKIHNMMMTKISDELTYRRNTDTVEASMEIAAKDHKKDTHHLMS